MKKQTYEISFKDAFCIYKENEKFRKTLDTGGFIYCENKYVINDEKYVAKCESGSLCLTEYAKSHKSECCLIFDLVDK